MLLMALKRYAFSALNRAPSVCTIENRVTAEPPMVFFVT